MFVRGSASSSAAVGTLPWQGWRWSSGRTPISSCGCCCYSCPQGRAARRSQVGSGRGRACRWGSGSVQRRSPGPLGPPCDRYPVAGATVTRSWAEGTREGHLGAESESLGLWRRFSRRTLESNLSSRIRKDGRREGIPLFTHSRHLPRLATLHRPKTLG